MNCCKYCGEPISESAKFCSNCGRPNEAVQHEDLKNPTYSAGTPSAYTEAEFILEEPEAISPEQGPKTEAAAPEPGNPHREPERKTEGPQKPEQPADKGQGQKPAQEERKTAGEQPKKASGLSVAAFICTLTVALSFLGIIMAVVDLLKDPEREKKHGLSIAALIIGGTVLLLAGIGNRFFRDDLIAETGSAQGTASSQISQLIPAISVQPALQTVQPAAAGAPEATATPKAAAAKPAEKATAAPAAKPTAAPVAKPADAPVKVSDSPVISILYGNGTLAGLREDGTVAATGFKKRKYNMDVSGWKDIVEIGSDYLGDYIVGLKKDGTVVVTGDFFRDPRPEIQTWKDIVSIRSDSTRIYGLRKNGTVVAAAITNNYDVVSPELEKWEGIQKIAVARNSIYGLKRDGRWIDFLGKYVEDYKDAVDFFDCGEYGVVLHSNGLMELMNEKGIKYDLPDWFNLKKLILTTNIAYGLKEDGTVVSVWDEQDSFYNERFEPIRSWTGMADIAGDWLSAVGLKKDGTIVYVGTDIGFDAEEWTRSAF